MDRTAHLDALASGERFDLAVVGGGATGLGVAVDAAARGLRVALVERGDFAQETSSRSTKLVHGGVRYLRQGNLRLVFEALRERGRLLRNAPHLVHHLAFVIPTYTWWEGPFYGVGMKVYDRLAGRMGIGASRFLDAPETRARLPNLRDEGLTGGVVYFDAQFDDARLAVHLARTAADLGATLANHAECVGLIREGGRVAGIEVRDRVDGAEFPLHARCVVNATGVFADTLRQTDDPGSPPLLLVSQGIHLVLPRSFLPGPAALMVPRTEDGRVLFAVPWQDRVVMGTTDTPRPGPVSEPRSLPEERQFVLDHAQRYLERAPAPEEVLSVFAGLRPLVRPADPDASTASVSRGHHLEVSPSGLVTITGGKWTTYRSMAAATVDAALHTLGMEPRPCPTRDLRIHGAPDHPAPVDEPLAGYGTDAHAIRALAEDDPSLARPLHPAFALTGAEVVWHARDEMACTVEDVLARRCRALLLDARSAMAAAPAVARVLAGVRGKDDAWARDQVAAFRLLARGYCFTDPASLATP